MRVFEGRFGRLALCDLDAQDRIEAHEDPCIALRRGEDEILLLNPGAFHVSLSAQRTLQFHACTEWLRERFPALFADPARGPFPEAREPITPRIRQLGEALAVEALNDRFLSPERLEFMLQELLLSIVDGCLSRRRPASLLWRGSRFEDSRIREAIALLRANPNKDRNMDELASQVGLSRSRFYDLFQLCTGFSPRTYLDMLCIEAAITHLSSGQGKIGDLSAQLGFSAQSNFTRFFLNQVGVPPSEYRRAATREPGEPQPSA